MRSELDRISKITRRLNTVGEGLWSFRKVDCMCHIRVIEQKIECSAADGGTPADGGALLMAGPPADGGAPADGGTPCRWRGPC